MNKLFQTRSEINGLNYFNTLAEALDAADKDRTIWKISFAAGNERVRLISGDNRTWVLEQM